MTNPKEIIRWIKALPSSSSVAVDDGGLTLVEVDKNGKQTDAYLEIGGVPTAEDLAEQAEEAAAEVASKAKKMKKTKARK